jgi:hypothetical protein
VIVSHFTALVVFAVLVSTVFAGINKTGAVAQFRYGLFIFCCFLLVAILVSWVMSPFPL